MFQRTLQTSQQVNGFLRHIFPFSKWKKLFPSWLFQVHNCLEVDFALEREENHNEIRNVACLLLWGNATLTILPYNWLTCIMWPFEDEISWDRGIYFRRPSTLTYGFESQSSYHAAQSASAGRCCCLGWKWRLGSWWSFLFASTLIRSTMRLEIWQISFFMFSVSLGVVLVVASSSSL